MHEITVLPVEEITVLPFPKATGVEQIMYSQYHTREPKASSLVPGLVVLDDGPGVLTCPRCRTSQPGIDHGKKRVCPGCGLKMQVWGNCLELTP